MCRLRKTAYDGLMTKRVRAFALLALAALLAAPAARPQSGRPGGRPEDPARGAGHLDSDRRPRAVPRADRGEDGRQVHALGQPGGPPRGGKRAAARVFVLPRGRRHGRQGSGRRELPRARRHRPLGDGRDERVEARGDLVSSRSRPRRAQHPVPARRRRGGAPRHARDLAHGARHVGRVPRRGRRGGRAGCRAPRP